MNRDDQKSETIFGRRKKKRFSCVKGTGLTKRREEGEKKERRRREEGEKKERIIFGKDGEKIIFLRPRTSPTKSIVPTEFGLNR